MQSIPNTAYAGQAVSILFGLSTDRPLDRLCGVFDYLYGDPTPYEREQIWA